MTIVNTIKAVAAKLRKRRSCPSQARLGLDNLEERRVMSVTSMGVSGAVADVLTVKCDGADDTVTVSSTGGYATVNGQVLTKEVVAWWGWRYTVPVTLSSLKTIVVDGGGGNDTIRMNLSKFMGTEVLIGGEGNDTLIGSDARTILRGGLGSDTMDGGVGIGRNTVEEDAHAVEMTLYDNRLFIRGTHPLTKQTYSDADNLMNVDEAKLVNSGSAHATIDARDTIKNVTLIGGTGNDLIWGSLYAGSVLNGGPGLGDDILVGGWRRDQLFGGEGDDILIGGEGQDTIYGNHGEDVIISGWTAHDDDAARLREIQRTWTDSVVDFDARVDALVDNHWNWHTVYADSSADELYGGAHHDFFYVQDFGKGIFEVGENWHPSNDYIVTPGAPFHPAATSEETYWDAAYELDDEDPSDLI